MSDRSAATHGASRSRAANRAVTSAPRGPGGPAHQTRLPPRQTLHDSVVDRLRDQIVRGTFALGDRLADAALAEQLGVSRTPVREALKVLAAEGLVVLIPRRGARVAGMTAKQIADLFEVICGLERNAVELAVQRMSRRDRTKLQAMHERMAGHFAAHDRDAYFAINHAIHLFLVNLSGNEILRETHDGLMAKVRRERYMALRFGERWEEAMAEHDQLMAAILRGEARLAGEIMLQHVRRTSEVVCAAFANQAAAAGTE